MSSNIRCWVPHCNVSKDKNFTRNFFPLPKDHKYKETWLALTGKKLISEDEVYFCEIHFRVRKFLSSIRNHYSLTMILFTEVNPPVGNG